MQILAPAIHRPGAGPVMPADNDGGDAVIRPVLVPRRPDLAAGEAPGQLVEQVEGAAQHVILGQRGQSGDGQPLGDAAQGGA